MPRRTQRDERTHHQGHLYNLASMPSILVPRRKIARRRPQAKCSPDFVSDHAARNQSGRVGNPSPVVMGSPFTIKVGAEEFGRL